MVNVMIALCFLNFVVCSINNVRGRDEIIS